MTELEKCNSGRWYYNDFPGRGSQHLAASNLCAKFNRIRPSNLKRRQRVMRAILGKMGDDCYIEQGFMCAFGFNLSVGDHFFANSNCFFMDDARISFGDWVFIGPGCAFYTAQHPIHPQQRMRRIERCLPITVGDHVWFGGDCVVLPGVTIGNNTVIGAGSVVTHGIPAGVVAAGNPCRVLRPVTEEDFYIDED